MNLIKTHCIVNVVDKSTIRPCRDDLIGLEPERELFKLENLLYFTDELHRELFLPHIIIALDNEPEEPPRFQIAKRAILSDSILLLFASLLDQNILLPRLLRRACDRRVQIHVRSSGLLG